MTMPRAVPDYAKLSRRLGEAAAGNCSYPSEHDICDALDHAAHDTAVLAALRKDLAESHEERETLRAQYAHQALAREKAEKESVALRARLQALEAAHWDRPRIVCLCGSTRFYQAFREANYRETMAGRIVLSVGFYPHAQDEAHGGDVGVNQQQKLALDALHLRKIDLADEVLVLNVGGYIGDSTRNEIAYAESTEKPVRYLEPLAGTIV